MVLVILDLDGTLCSISREEWTNAPPPDMVFRERFIYRRPFLDTFLDTLMTFHQVAVWTCKRQEYAEEVVRFLFGDRFDKLVFVHYQQHIDRSNRAAWVKPLDRVRREYGYSESEMLLVDDTPSKAGEYQHCLLVSPTFNETAAQKGDTWLLQALGAINDYADASGVESEPRET
jgi:RNA polymerase II subunit A small phosphatase-like protein